MKQFKKKLINLTPHDVVFSVGEETVTLKSEGIARVETKTEIIGEIEILGVKVPVKKTVFLREQVTGLPDPQDDVLYIVSSLVRSALPERDDLVSTTDFIRENGVVVAARALTF